MTKKQSLTANAIIAGRGVEMEIDQALSTMRRHGYVVEQLPSGLWTWALRQNIGALDEFRVTGATESFLIGTATRLSANPKQSAKAQIQYLQSTLQEKDAEIERLKQENQNLRDAMDAASESLEDGENLFIALRFLEERSITGKDTNK